MGEFILSPGATLSTNFVPNLTKIPETFLLKTFLYLYTFINLSFNNPQSYCAKKYRIYLQYFFWFAGKIFNNS